MYALLGLGCNPKEILGAKAATKTFEDLSIFSEVFCFIGDEPL